MQQPGILQPAEPDSLSIGHRRFTEASAEPEPISTIMHCRRVHCALQLRPLLLYLPWSLLYALGIPSI
jgi:hypothetical protein